MRTLLIVAFLMLQTPLVKAQNAGTAVPFHYVGHRGASYLAPENTLTAIQLAWELGAHGAECDVMLTADKKVVLFHDKNTKNLTGQNLSVEEASWEELKPLVVIPRETNRPEYSNETIPLLEDVLAARIDNMKGRKRRITDVPRTPAFARHRPCSRCTPFGHSAVMLTFFLSNS